MRVSRGVSIPTESQRRNAGGVLCRQARDPCPLVGYFKDQTMPPPPPPWMITEKAGCRPPCQYDRSRPAVRCAVTHDSDHSDSVAVFGHDRGGVGIKMTLHAGRPEPWQQRLGRLQRCPGLIGGCILVGWPSSPKAYCSPVRMSADGHGRENFHPRMVRVTGAAWRIFSPQ